jgi:ribosomal protein S14
MSNQKIRDHARRLIMAKYEIKRIQHKAIWQDRNLANSVRYSSFFQLSKINRNSSLTRIRNRCVITGRARSVYNKMRISRIVFREFAAKGAIMGVCKSSW